MQNAPFIIILSFSLMACSSASQDSQSANASNSTVEHSLSYEFDGNSTPGMVAEQNVTDQENSYPGKTIDMVFPLTVDVSREDLNEKQHGKFAQSGFSVNTKGLMPTTLVRNGKRVLTFDTAYEWDSYRGFLLGESKLVGLKSKQLYIISTGPGGPCCTNYWIVDITKQTPKLIFRSEEFGGFRDPMEIFDADDDGIYELMQFDTCFRYFNDDCGSCSPEPRAYFKYDPSRKKYLPTKGIVQDFVKEDLKSTEKWLVEKLLEMKSSANTNLQFDINRTAISYAADLFYIGEDKKGWKIFNRYVDDPHGKLKQEMKDRLAGCKFYQALKSIPK